MSPAVRQRPAQVAAGRIADPVAATGVPVLVRGVLVIRWAVLAWMTVVIASAVVAGRDSGVAAAIAALCVATSWVTWLTVAGRSRSVGTTRAGASEPASGDTNRETTRGPVRGDTVVLVVDLVVAGILVVVGTREPWFATVYPVTAALAWGAARGTRRGILAGGSLGLVSIVAWLLSDGTPAAQAPVIALLRDPVNFVLAGGVLGFVADLLERSAAQVRAAQAEQVRATEQAARATERESMGRHIHDSVLQALALVHKRGRELAERPQVPGAEVGRLAELAAAQERAMRAMIVRPPHDSPAAVPTAALRDQLEAAAAVVAAEVDVSVTSVGDIPLPTRHVRELAAAVEQALANVVQHAEARHAWVFAEVDADCVVVSVRDDGRGFTFDEDALRAAHNFGLLRSIRGRIDDLGGTVQIDTAPGRGTELELRVPAPTGDGQEHGTSG
ncbi:MAG TPA: ATP-binding protein [Euzebyales bacterium]|nr:ATP-binding protein [Euzebyales bacterium]